MKKGFLVISLLIIALTSCTKKPGILIGNVFWKYNDYIGNKPDSGTEINIYSLTDKKCKYKTTADISGNYKIESIVPGKYFIIMQSSNTTDSPEDHLDNLLVNSDELKTLFGFDVSKFKDEINEINLLKDKYDKVLSDTDLDKYGGIDKKITAYDKIQDDIKNKSISLIQKFATEFESKLDSQFGLYYVYFKSFDFATIEIKENQTSTKNTDFGTTYN